MARPEESATEEDRKSGPPWFRLRSRLPVWAEPLLASSSFVVSLWALGALLEEFHLHEIRASLEAIPASRIALALALTLINHLVFPCYDELALRSLGRQVPLRRVVFASWLGNALSSGLGFPFFTGEAARWRLYARWGLDGASVAALIAFNSLSLLLGWSLVTGTMVVADARVFPASWSGMPVDLLGVVLIALPLLFIASSLRRRKWIARFWPAVETRATRTSVEQVALGSVDWLLGGLTAYVLLPEASVPPVASFLLVYFLAQAAGILAHVPQGLGVFETIVIALLHEQQTPASLMAGLVAYRAIYYLLPLAVSGVALAVEALRQRRWHERLDASLSRVVNPILPTLLSGAVFLAGVVLLLSGATPAEAPRLQILSHVLPLPFLEVSHFLASIVGVLLLFLARALQQRVDSAYLLTQALLWLGALLSLLKGLDYEEATILAAVALLLIPGRAAFHRRGAIFVQRWTPGWIAAVASVLLGACWLGVFAYKHVEFRDDLWWRFALDGDAPRFLRASFGAVLLAVSIAVVQLLQPGKPRLELPGAAEQRELAALLPEIDASEAHLVRTGDKHVLWSDSRRSFLMFGVLGRTWVSFRGPFGEESERLPLCEQFLALADRHGGWPAFQEVAARDLPLYLDLGLSLSKVGEEARVPLRDFSLEGSARASLRHARQRALRDGLSFRVVEASEVRPLLPVLREISDSWLREKRTREKRFSLGFFDEEYIAGAPVGVVDRDGVIAAFANLWPGGHRRELSLDLMRHVGGARGVMDYLFVELMLWGREQGYEEFNLGLAPLSGLELGPFAPAWQRFASLLYKHGEHFYNFGGLRQFKEKFDPAWEPRYLAVAEGAGVPRVLADMAALSSGGWRGLLSK